MGERCEDCKWWLDPDEYVPTNETMFAGMSQCRARAPIGLIVNDYLVPREGSYYVSGEWPIVSKNDWCGEFAPAPNKEG